MFQPAVTRVKVYPSMPLPRSLLGIPANLSRQALTQQLLLVPPDMKKPTEDEPAFTHSPSEAKLGLQVPGEDDALLVAVANTQDRDSFEKLFSLYARRIYGLGKKLTDNHQLATELVQEVMLTVWRSASTFNIDKGSAQTWIFTLSRNHCFDLMRKQKRQPISIDSQDIWPADGEEGSDSDFLSQTKDEGPFKAEIARIHRFSEKLPLPQRQAIESIYIHGHSQEEAATLLKIPLGTFKSRLRLGLIKLREMAND